MMSIADEIERLASLRRDGTITEDQFERAKETLFDAPKPTASTKPTESNGPPESNGPTGSNGATEPTEPEFDPYQRDAGDDCGSAKNTVSNGDVVSTDDATYAVMIHLSQFFGYLVPLAGLVAPIILWQIRKNESEVVDLHGRVVANWIMTELLLFGLFGLLAFVVVGIPLIIILASLGIIFPIIGGIKAGDGKLWPYPMSIRFFDI